MTKSKSVLKRQRPKRERRRGHPTGRRTAWLLVSLGLAILVVSVGVYTAVRPRKSLTASDSSATTLSKKSIANMPWRVALKLEGDEALPEPAATEIIKLAQRHLGRGDHTDLAATATAIQRLDGYTDVHVLKLGSHEAAVRIRRRVPSLCVKADHLRFVASDGSVYGTATPPCRNPMLTGVFDDPLAKFTLKDDFTLSLSEAQSEIIKDALELQGLGRDQGFRFSEISFKRHRGFFVKINPIDSEKGDEQTQDSSDIDRLEVALGHAPFANKLAKLRDIMTKLQEKGEQAVRIELDYHGKAFVKHKKDLTSLPQGTPQ